ncbi:F-box/kelch-repeat protein At3g23880-like [Solanum stenotomum]|uniref:F-box/kelch-repeat protein At3g23880-like n=1 Tax=Solanum stenotomum TaxID=172797 RepID=UPI0020D09A16|nr:F-box/kelch-repeat protein At3g23880-like [Solanum stenotomum]
MHEGKLAIRAAKKTKKKSIANIEKTNLFKQISISNGEETTKFSRCKQKKKSNQICKGKRMSSDTTEQMDIVCPQARGNQCKEEIIIEILSKIPVRSILRFKCVSKSWKELISDHYFKMKHLDHAKNDQNSNKLLINKKCLDKDDVFNIYCSTLSSVQVVEDEHELDWPSNCNPEDSVLYCSCDGLVLLAIYNGLDRHLLLWNPSTGESIVLPHPKSRPKYCVCGMGYDATIDEYKILAIDLHETCQEITVEILTLKGGSWKEICKYPPGIHRVIGVKDCGMYSLAFVHGAFHWVGLSSHCCTIVSFNISNEMYGEIPLLEHMCNINKARFIEYGVSVLGGMLCFCSTYFNPWGGMFKLWMMKEYGVKESWTELLTIQGDSIFFYSAKPIYMYADGEVLLRCNYFGVLGSVYRTSRERFGLLPQCRTFKQGMVYTQSLISPKSLITFA